MRFFLAIIIPLVVALLIIGCGTENSNMGFGPFCTLVWTSYKNGPPNIWMLDLPDGTPRQLTFFDGGAGREGVSLSSNGWVYFGARNMDEFNWEVWRIPRSGGNPQKLTESSQYDGQPTVSPNGEWVCFMTKRWYHPRDIDYDRELALMPASGGTATRLTYWNGSDDQPVWSPTQNLIAFVRANSLGRFTIATLCPDTPESVRIWTPPNEDAWAPSWNSDGSAIICVITNNGIKDIAKIGIPSGEIFNITNSRESDDKPAISPNGEWIAHQVYRAGSWDIAITKIDGSQTRFISTNPAEDISPCWSPDGSWVFWVSCRDSDREIYGSPIDLSDGPFRITHFVGDDIRPQCWAR